MEQPPPLPAARMEVETEPVIFAIRKDAHGYDIVANLDDKEEGVTSPNTADEVGELPGPMDIYKKAVYERLEFEFGDGGSGWLRDDQMVQAIDQMLHTLKMYSQKPTEIVTTDNPSGDKDFFLAALPSLAHKQLEPNGLTPQSTGSDQVHIC